MKRAPSAFALAVVLLSVTLAGCTQGGDTQDDDAAPVEDARSRLLGMHPMPTPDGAAAHDLLVDFVSAHSMRVTATPAEQEATAWLVDRLTVLGYDVHVQDVSQDAGGLPVPVELPADTLHAIVATMPGKTMPDNWLAWGGHYDSVPQTIEGAYDNGSGTIVSLEVARMMAQVETNRTKAVILFNGEEQGVQASSAYVNWYEAQDDFVIDTFVGFDMVGIAYPAPGRPLAFFSAEPYAVEFVGLARDVAFNLLELPEEDGAVVLRGENTRNSDEASFAAVDVPTMRFAGLRTASAYWGYHLPNDTMETIYAMSGATPAEGQENFSQGMANTAAFAYGMLVALDVRGPPTPVSRG